MHNLIRISGRSLVRTILVLALALCTSAGLAQAGNAPNIDGNGDDIISLAGSIGSGGCSVDLADNRDDIAISDPAIIVCATKEDTTVPPDGELDYFINGYDLRRFVFVYDRQAQAAYILWRTEGRIGDVDGNLNPDNNLCPPSLPSFPDEVGIGSQENYQVRIDTNCDGLPDITIGVGGGQTADAVSVVGSSFGGSDLEYRAGAGSGNDLELAITGLSLPQVFRISANTNASFDGLGEDITPIRQCGEALPNISIEKSVLPAVICPGQTADFTLLVTNTGNVPLTGVTVVDNLPAPLDFVSTVSNTCGGPVNQVGDQITYGPFDLDTGASCTIVIRVSRTAECQGEQTNLASVEGTFQSPCVNEGVAIVVTDEDSATLLCGNIQCSIDAPDTRVCGTETVEICGPVGDFTYAWSNGATTRCINVGAGTYSLTITDNASGCVSTNPCTVTILQDTPQIEVVKDVSPSGPVEQGTLLTYTLTVTNPQKSDVTVENLVVRDILCSEVTYQNNASHVPTSAPNIGESGTIVWNFPSLAPGNSITITFDARVRELPNPDCEATGRECTNRVEVSAFCGANEATDSDEVTTPINPCLQPGLCRLTGGGCLNEDGDNRGHKQSTFGGNSSPLHEGGGPSGNSWEHVYRDGREILFNWHSWDAHVIQCTVVPPGPCHPQAENTRADFVGTGLYSEGSGGREFEGNMVAYIIDHREGSCNRENRDEYSIIVRTGLTIGSGDIVFQTSGEIDCGNLQIHETPRRLFGNGVAPDPGSQVGSIDGVALLNKAVPNPFSGSMSYAYEVVGQDQPVDIGVYNVAGRLVKSLTKSSMPVGRHTVSWNGTDDSGAKVSGGVYFVRVRLGGASQQHRVIFLGK